MGDETSGDCTRSEIADIKTTELRHNYIWSIRSYIMETTCQTADPFPVPGRSPRPVVVSTVSLAGWPSLAFRWRSIDFPSPELGLLGRLGLLGPETVQQERNVEEGLEPTTNIAKKQDSYS